jgi:hypothetical protein
VLVTDWPQFRTLDFDRLKRIMHTPTIVDLRNAYAAQEMIDRGFRYSGIGVGRESEPVASVEQERPPTLMRRPPRRANGHGMVVRKHERPANRSERGVVRSP